MATVTKWVPFGVALDITATAATVTRKSATRYTVNINASWETYYNGATTNYGMTASSGGGSATINKFGTYASRGSGSFTGSYSISGNGSATKTITVTFKNFNSDNGDSATKAVSIDVTVPAWTSYTVKYNANGGSPTPSNQTKWKDQTLTLSSIKPTRTGYSFLGWATSSTATSATYAAGGSYTTNAAVTLYAVWKANTYTIAYNANGGSGAPSTQTKTYGATLKLSTVVPAKANYNFKGWATSATATTATYAAGGNYTANAATTLYAVWELAYIEPRISSIILARCDKDGNPTDEGNYARVNFDWNTDVNVTSVVIKWKLASNSNYATGDSKPIPASGTKDTVEEVIGGAFLADKTYTIRIEVADSNGNNAVMRDLAGSIYHIDLKPPTTADDVGGIGFGKPAELDGVADIGYKTRFYGGILHLVLEPDTDLDNVLTPNTYTSFNRLTESYANAPAGLTGTFTLEVMGAGAEGQMLQRLTSCSKTDPNQYIRFYYQGAWGKWIRQYEVVLYNNTSGSGDVITLSESAENFEYIEIFYTDNNNKVGGSVKVYSPQNKTVSLSVIEAGTATTTYFRRTSYHILGSSLTPNVESAGYVRISTATPSHTSGANYIKICRVVGFERGFM